MLVAGVWALMMLIVLDVYEKHPKAKYLPLPMAVAVGMIGPAFVSFEGVSMGIIGLIWQRRNPKGYSNGDNNECDYPERDLISFDLISKILASAQW